MTTHAEDRLALLLAQSSLTGIDFVYVSESQDRLDVYFLRAPESLDVPLPGSIPIRAVRVTSVRDEHLPPVVITSLNWVVVDGRTVMRLAVVRPASFTDHRLELNDPLAPARIDPFYRSVVFSFQANCPTGLDCAPDAPAPFPETYVDFPVDYSARDFLSFRRALLDFAAQRYPRWVDQLEADVGVMLVEVMSALGDEMAYTQDRISREVYLATASQRFSVRQLARLVDYDLFDGEAASVMLDLTATAPGVVPVGTRVSDADGVHTFEVGAGLFDDSGGYAVDPARNRFLPYFWDEDDVELPVGATELFVLGAAGAAFPPLTGGYPILVQTNPLDPSDPAMRVFVHLLDVTESTDPLTGDAISRLRWDTPTPYPMDKTALEVRGNLLPATAGATQPRFAFSIGASADPAAPATRAVVRRGANGVPIYRVTLPGSEDAALAFVRDASRGGLRAEVRLRLAENIGGVWEPVVTEEWDWRASLLGASSSTSFDPHWTLDDGSWGRVVGFPITGGEWEHADYRSGTGMTIRFGDGEFGMLPPDGAVFVADYRLHTSHNLPRSVLTRIDPATPLAFVSAVTNPEATAGALPAESLDSVKANAPEAFRALTYRAVKPDDYAEAVERLAWVQNAGASMRWTGSWRTIFASADPRGAVALSQQQRSEATQQIDRFRQAGQDARQRPPHFANLDIEIAVCAEPSSYAGAVKQDVFDALVGPGGFFDPDNFTFGTVLHRGALEAAAGAVAGVLAVESIRFRRRGFFDWREFGFVEAFYAPGIDTILRVRNDRAFPDQGTVRVIVRGGA